MKKFNESAKAEKLLGWVYNPETVKTEIATLATVGKNMGNPLNEGIVKVCADARKQVDDFLASQK
ncbi:hypothetical protein CLHUN_09750 [Ruminiclostridium hungatei]|uniref:DUF3502 domain-containing protein n=1 Tax=Ruminiclostridium hungatei TaxID=48256 RepID=A0A1V4SMH5_RUMHU|nr:hypothetical protein CLHUN_09750 [Ruminiclostridium hungatei]